jgi:hypothetical protein
VLGAAIGEGGWNVSLCFSFRFNAVALGNRSGLVGPSSAVEDFRVFDGLVQMVK